MTAQPTAQSHPPQEAYARRADAFFFVLVFFVLVLRRLAAARWGEREACRRVWLLPFAAPLSERGLSRRSASAVSFLSVAFSSLSVRVSSGTSRRWPSSFAQAMRAP